MRVTEKGQVTIPKNVRRHLGIAPGSEVEFVFVEDGALLRKAQMPDEEHQRDVQEFMEHIRRHKGSMNLAGRTADEFYGMLRD